MYIYYLVVISWTVLFIKPMLRHHEVLRAVAPLRNCSPVGLLPFTHHKLYRVVFGVACEEGHSLIAGADSPVLALDVTLLLN